jgi:CDP-glucose 4,6-dehydratase
VGFRESAMENLVKADFWKGKKVLITGHTGFKGGWLSFWLKILGADVVGYALPPSTNPNLFQIADISRGMSSVVADMRDFAHLKRILAQSEPEIVFHLAAQPLVRYSYVDPLETYSTNVMGTVNLLEAVRQTGGARAIVIVTSDKCYENRESSRGYREDDRLGGYDPYSSSKACVELVTSAYRDSFFNPADHSTHGVALASARSGNVLGGGDWAQDRLIPDVVRAFFSEEDVVIRNPRAVRPWQHVLEPSSGYLMLAERLWREGAEYAEAWNFGPDDSDAKPVQWIVERVTEAWGRAGAWKLDTGEHPHETTSLRLDCSKAKERLGWRPRWTLDRALLAVSEWYRAYQAGMGIPQVMFEQIAQYQAT